ncbi:YesL family protein [Pseudalkalibacillus hwajinpoensis]|uniref:YesL family protein n=1 Tax=Guptibacillus hwajinpoensis TaxID=208199 RepID=UPI00325C195A
MNGNQIVTTLDVILHWIMRLALLNSLWLLYSLRGLIVGGVFPALVASMGVSRKWLMGDEDIKIWKTFKGIYRQEFTKANIIGWLLTVIGSLLYLNYRLLESSTSEVMFIIPFAFYLICFFYVIVFLWTFPMLAHYDATWQQHLKNAFVVGLTKIHFTLASGVVVFAICYYSLGFPGLIPFFTIGFISVGCMWLSLQVFQKLDLHSTFPMVVPE